MPLKFLTHDKISYTLATLPYNRNLPKIAKIRLYFLANYCLLLVSNNGTTAKLKRCKFKMSVATHQACFTTKLLGQNLATFSHSAVTPIAYMQHTENTSKTCVI